MTVKYRMNDIQLRIPYIYQNLRQRRFEISVPRKLQKYFRRKKLTFSFQYMQKCRTTSLHEISELIAPYYIEMFDKVTNGELAVDGIERYMREFKDEIEILYNSNPEDLLKILLNEMLKKDVAAKYKSVQYAVVHAVRSIRKLRIEAQVVESLMAFMDSPDIADYIKSFATPTVELD